MRYAIYFTPEANDPLTRVAARWLGRDAFTGETMSPPAAEPLSASEVAFHTAAARRYGFHATLRAPFRLTEGRSEAALVESLDRFAATTSPVFVPRIELRRMDGFFAIVPAVPSGDLSRFAADIVQLSEPYRAPLTQAENERRNPDGLTPGQLKNLHKWGYPYVFEEFRFHMTLTGRVATDASNRVEQAIERHFGPLLMEPFELTGFALFVEPEPGAPFMVKSFHSLGTARQRKTA